MTECDSKKTIAWLLLDGAFPDEDTLRHLHRIADRVVAADGAAAGLLRIGLTPDLVVGDMDSLPSELIHKLAPEQLKQCVGQNDSDIDKALSALFAAGTPPDLLYVTGALGGRVDHMLANLAALTRYAQRTQIVVLDPTCRIWFVTGRLELDCEPNDVISLLAAPNVATVSISSVQWPLDHAQLEPGTLGISNRALSHHVVLTTHSGMVLCIHQRPVTGGCL